MPWACTSSRGARRLGLCVRPRARPPAQAPAAQARDRAPRAPAGRRAPRPRAAVALLQGRPGEGRGRRRPGAAARRTSARCSPSATPSSTCGGRWRETSPGSRPRTGSRLGTRRCGRVARLARQFGCGTVGRAPVMAVVRQDGGAPGGAGGRGGGVVPGGQLVWKRPSGNVTSRSPSGSNFASKPVLCSIRWCRRHSNTPLSILVGPSSASHSFTWCTSHHDAGRSHPGNRQPRSRTAMAL